MLRLLLAILFALAAAQSATALEHVKFQQDGAQREVVGEVIVTAADGGILLLGADGTMWAIEPDDLEKRFNDTAELAPLAPEALGRQLLADLPAGFEVYTTNHYVICHDTSREYAAWCGALFERLYRGFTNYWSRKGLKLEEPRFPLVAVVFSSREAYARYAKAELGDAADAIVGYYSFRTNRITMCDLTGIESLRAAGSRRSSEAQINLMLSRPEAEHSVATIIHEATHQIAFNSGLQTRFADIPLWVSEGLAVFFETPDLSSARGWRTIGALNQNRLTQFRQYLSNRPQTSLKTLIADDKRIRDTRTSLDAYAEAWALNYYLLNHHPRQYTEYLKMLSAKPPLVWDDPETRVSEFQQAFGKNLSQLDADFLRYMQRLK